ncbi:MAG: porin family protein [Longimicrobiales bacterium]|nr:porin family protein [Longimicrobiales bacterium]
MKKLSLVVLLASLGIAAPAAAQPVVGFHGGLNISDHGGDVDAGTETGANVGASILFPLSGSLGLYIGGSYSEKGASSDEFRDGLGGARELILDYLDIPVLLRYGFPLPGSVGFHVYGGGALSFELDCELNVLAEGHIDIVGFPASGDCDDDAVDFETNTVDFGLMAGAGIDYGIGAGIDLVLDLFYNYGLRDIEAGTDLDVRNRTFSVRAGVAVPLG